MAYDVWQQGMLTPVYWKMGAFEFDGSKTRLQKAPFKLIYFQNSSSERHDLYVCPDGVDDVAQLLVVDDAKNMMAREDFGFYTGEQVVIEKNQLGDPSQDGWIGCHHFDLY